MDKRTLLAIGAAVGILGMGAIAGCGPKPDDAAASPAAPDAAAPAAPGAAAPAGGAMASPAAGAMASPGALPTVNTAPGPPPVSTAPK